MQRTFWLVSLSTLSAVAAPLGLDDLRAQRHELAFRQRRILANNDGCDALYFPREAKLTPQAFLDLRTTALADTQVDCISYCTISSGSASSPTTPRWARCSPARPTTTTSSRRNGTSLPS